MVANTALLANAHLFLVTFLGKGTDKWLPAATALKILCVYGIIGAITEPIANCIMARGRTEMLLHASSLAGAVELALILLVLRTGRIELVAGAVLIAYATQAIIYLPYLAPGICDQFWRSRRAIVARGPCDDCGLPDHVAAAYVNRGHASHAGRQRIVHRFGRRVDAWGFQPIPMLPRSARDDCAKFCSYRRLRCLIQVKSAALLLLLWLCSAGRRRTE